MLLWSNGCRLVFFNLKVIGSGSNFGWKLLFFSFLFNNSFNIFILFSFFAISFLTTFYYL